MPQGHAKMSTALESYRGTQMQRWPGPRRRRAWAPSLGLRLHKSRRKSKFSRAFSCFCAEALRLWQHR
eukprot:1161902-Pelagomonas_calceolata.AAC.6